MDHCNELVVGAGWAGVYLAYRRATNISDPTSICLVEASQRIGGRTYSRRHNAIRDLTLDLGAYRFSPDMHLPGDLILNHLNLTTACYEPGCPSAKDDMPPPFIFNYSAPLRRVVDPLTKLPTGYATPIETLVDRLRTLGVTVRTGVALRRVAPAPPTSGTGIDFELSDDSVVRSPRAAWLNLPRNHVFAVEGFAGLAGNRTSSALRCVRFDQPKKMFQNWTHLGHHSPSSLSKAYYGYRDAWWHTKVNLTTGEYPANSFFPIETKSGIPIGVRWSDGPVGCSSGGAACAGYLEAFYTVSNETFFQGLAKPGTPFGRLTPVDAASKAKLATAHAALLEAISPLLAERGVSPASLGPPPDEIVVGVWMRPDDKYPLGPAVGLSAPTKVYYSPEMSGSLAQACGVSGLTEAEYRARAMQPFGDTAVYMANNDWVAQNVRYMYGDWAEETLLQAERALLHFGLARPEWLDAAYYGEKIAGYA